MRYVTNVLLALILAVVSYMAYAQHQEYVRLRCDAAIAKARARIGLTEKVFDDERLKIGEDDVRAACGLRVY